MSKKAEAEKQGTIEQPKAEEKPQPKEVEAKGDSQRSSLDLMYNSLRHLHFAARNHSEVSNNKNVARAFVDLKKGLEMIERVGKLDKRVVKILKEQG